MSLLPWNLVLQIALLPVYLWLLVGKVVPVSAGTLLASVGVYLIAPFALGYAVRVLLIRSKGREWAYGPYKQAIGEVKLWALAALIIAIFAFQPSFGGLGLARIALIIAATIIFFAGLFAHRRGLAPGGTAPVGATRNVGRLPGPDLCCCCVGSKARAARDTWLASKIHAVAAGARTVVGTHGLIVESVPAALPAAQPGWPGSRPAGSVG